MTVTGEWVRIWKELPSIVSRYCSRTGLETERNHEIRTRFSRNPADI